MLDERIRDILLSNERKLILLHHNADIDAVASATALKLSFPNFFLFAPLGISAGGKKVLNYAKVTVEENVDLDQYDWIFIVDTNTIEQLGEIHWDKIKERTVVIDHHALNPKFLEAHLYIQMEETSTAEVLYNLFEKIGVEITEKVAEILLMGILGDTGRFKFARNSTFYNVIGLLGYTSQEISSIIDYLEDRGASQSMEKGRRIALLKAMQRATFIDFGNFIIVKSFVSAFEGDAASLFVSTVADIAIIGAQRDEEARVSARARQWIVSKGLNLAEICRKVGEAFNGGGGGHPAAAGINVVGDAEAIVNACVEETIEELRRILKNEKAKRFSGI